MYLRQGYSNKEDETGLLKIESNEFKVRLLI